LFDVPENVRTTSVASARYFHLFKRPTNINTNEQMPYKHKHKLEMWANAQRDGRPAEYRWRPLFNTAKFG